MPVRAPFNWRQQCCLPRDCFSNGVWVDPGITQTPDDVVDGAPLWKIGKSVITDRHVVSSHIAVLGACCSFNDFFGADLDLVRFRFRKWEYLLDVDEQSSGIAVRAESDTFYV